MEKFVCELCGNTDLRYVGTLNGKLYCRKCISFKGELAEKELSYLDDKKSRAYLNYELSKEQIEISNRLVENFKNHINTLIFAVCGAGKTELIFGVIEYALNQKLKIGFAIPRKDVVIELAKRLQNTFKKNIVTALYGGNTTLLYGDIICLTTHQLYRYKNYFDLLILDEIDAFPYKGNEVLNAIFKRSIKGNYILMSATPDSRTLNEFKEKGHDLITLFTRYHKKPIPVPKIVIRISFFKILFLIKKLNQYKKESKPCLVFAPTINECEDLYSIVKHFVKEGDYVHSKRKNRGEIIDFFRENKTKYLVTTAVLERGVTLKNLQVIIYNADNEIYNKESLLQISGRVGRVIGATDGEIIYLSKRKTEYMEKAIEFTKRANSNL